MSKEIEDILQQLQSARLLINNDDYESFVNSMENIYAISEYFKSHDCKKELILKVLNEVNTLIKETELKNNLLASKIRDVRKHQNANQIYQNNI
ncbi:MAG: hypothetical protein HYX61_04085 [Gammaproteobacteria bacterium]|jgi:hypothetical protein|nr:hypothetical protein [Gammaproteobacteria bacterium]